MLGDMNSDLDPGYGPATPAYPCEHAWVTDSRHRTSQGIVAYVRCVRCPALRVELGAPASTVPARAVSVPVGVFAGTKAAAPSYFLPARLPTRP